MNTLLVRKASAQVDPGGITVAQIDPYLTPQIDPGMVITDPQADPGQ
jgi:hypothetical protein